MTSIGPAAAAVAHGVVEQVSDDVDEHHLVRAVNGSVAIAEETDVGIGVTDDLAFDGRDDEAADRDGLADRTDAVPLGVDQDHQVLDEAVEAVRLDAHVRRQRAAAIRRQVLRGKQLRPAVDRRDGRPELVRKDVEECLAIALADEPIVAGVGGRGRARPTGWAGGATSSRLRMGRQIARHHGRIVRPRRVTGRQGGPQPRYGRVAQKDRRSTAAPKAAPLSPPCKGNGWCPQAPPAPRAHKVVVTPQGGTPS